MKKIHLEIVHEERFSLKNLYQVARSIQRLPRLESFTRWFYIRTQQTQISLPKELRSYSRSAPRLSNLKNMNFFQGLEDFYGFQVAMNQNVLFPGISRIKIMLTESEIPNFLDLIDENFDNEEGMFSVDESTVDQIVGQAKDVIDPKIQRYLLQIQETKPFFRFELFPNLQRLCIQGIDFTLPLGSFVLDGFKSLKKLTHLKIQLESRPRGMFFFFKKPPIIAKVFLIYLLYEYKRMGSPAKFFENSEEPSQVEPLYSQQVLLSSSRNFLQT